MKPASIGRLATDSAAPRGLACPVRRRIITGFSLMATLLLGVGGWMVFASIAGAVVAPGYIVVDSNVKRVQHPAGGIVSAIFVRNGDRVAAGDILLRLDDTQTRANLGIVSSQLVDLRGRKARLIAERDDAETVTFPPGFEDSGEDFARVAAGERRLFEAKRTATAGQKSQLKERVGQIRKEIEGLSAQKAAKSEELKLILREQQRVADMHARKLVPETRLLAISRDVIRIEGEHGALVAQIARLAGQIHETELQLLQLDHVIQSDAQKELRDVEARIAELAERAVAAEDLLKRIDVRAPQSGVVHDLSVHTVGGVIGPGETVMFVVPNDDVLAIEVRVPPTDIDQVNLGQKCVLRFPAFNQRTTPELAGTVSRVAADLTRETQTGFTYYLARISVSTDEMSKLKELKLLPGMPVESFIETGDRTVLSYLMKPFNDQISRAFRED
ncbi:MAG: HlyD family type I secretion periplasmic adaptor subunit [Hyphomicrobiaceae bacterium]|nr:HlyD family type I secretion periplasmic adaptor subunit [Hyphomicrobiaceae bacterium]